MNADDERAAKIARRRARRIVLDAARDAAIAQQFGAVDADAYAADKARINEALREQADARDGGITTVLRLPVVALAAWRRGRAFGQPPLRDVSIDPDGGLMEVYGDDAA